MTALEMVDAPQPRSRLCRGKPRSIPNPQGSLTKSSSFPSASDIRVRPGVVIKGGSVGDDERNRVDELLDLLSLSGLADKNANQLSGGQKQRVAIGRALMNRPSMILADEPTGNLDSWNSSAVYELFREINRER